MPAPPVSATYLSHDGGAGGFACESGFVTLCHGQLNTRQKHFLIEIVLLKSFQAISVRLPA
jgi:hypothetical protein